MTAGQQHSEIMQWIKVTAKEIKDAMLKSDIPERHINTLIEARLMEFTIIHGLILTSGCECESERRGRKPTLSDPDSR